MDVDVTIKRYFRKELFSRFLPWTYAGHVSLAAHTSLGDAAKVARWRHASLDIAYNSALRGGRIRGGKERWVMDYCEGLAILLYIVTDNTDMKTKWLQRRNVGS